MKEQRTNWIEKIQNDILWQKIAIILLCMYMFASIPRISMVYFEVIESFRDEILPIFVCVTLGMRIYLLLKRIRYAWAYGLAASVVSYFVLFFLANSYFQFIFPIVLGLALIKINYSRILSYVLYTVVPALLIIILLSRTGLIPNLVYYVSGTPRLTFGTVYCTDFAAFVFYMTMLFVGIDKQIPKYLRGIVCFIVSIVMYLLCRSTCSSLCLGIAGIGCIYLYCYETISKKQRYGRFINAINNCINVLEVCMFIILAGLSLVLTLCYGTYDEWILKINDKLHARLGLGYSAVKEYGLSFFGNSSFVQSGGGGTTNSNFTYNFIDSSYMYTMVRWGFLILVVLAVLYIIVVVRAQKRGNYLIPMVMAVIAIHSFEEHHFIEPWFNVFMFTFVCDYERKSVDNSINLKTVIIDFTNRVRPEINNKSKVFIMLFITVMMAVEIVMFPRQSAAVRTISKANEVDNNILFQLIAILVIGIIILWIGMGMSQLTHIFSKPKKVLLISFVSVGLLLVFGSVILFNSSNSVKEYYVADIKTDETILNELNDNGIKNGVYVDSSADYYSRYSAIEQRFFYDEELSLVKNCTYLCSDEYQRFNGADFSVVQYSDDRMLYTNSTKVIDTLKDKGYIVYDRFPKVFSLIDTDDSVILGDDINNEEIKLIYKTESDIYKSGIYKLHITINVDAIKADTDYELLEIDTIYPGKEYRRIINISDLHEGEYTVFMSISNCDSLYFILHPSDGGIVEITSFTLEKWCDM